jgi:putative sigma-54 modulation protein
MRLELTGRHVTITPNLRRLVEGQLARLDRFLNDSGISAQVVLTQEKYRHHVEMTLHARGEHFMHGVGNARDWETSVRQAIEKIESQVQKLKGKWNGRKRRGASAAKLIPASARAAAAEEGQAEQGQTVRIIRARRYAVKPMSVDEAALEVGDGRDAFIVFRNSSTETINVLFRRPDGNLGLIEPEA